MNINTGQMEALEHVKKNGKDIHSNKLVLSYWIRKQVWLQNILSSLSPVSSALAEDPSTWTMHVPVQTAAGNL